MPSLQQLKYIAAVDQFRSFSKAAAFCHVSQPSLSQQIREAEEEMGLSLFDRDKRKVQPTERGQVLLEQIRVILHESEKLNLLSRQEKGEVRGDLALGVIPTLAPYLVPLFLKKFVELYPKVKIRIMVLKTEDMIAALKSDQIDAGLLVTPLEEKSIYERVLFYEPMLAYVHPDHELYHLKRLTENDLKVGQIWLLSEGHCFRNQMVNICGIRTKNQVFKNVEFESGDFETLIQLVRRNGGYTLLPFLATQSLHEKELRSGLRTFTQPVPTREVSLVHSRSALKIEIVEALESVIQKCLPSGLPRSRDAKMDIIEIESSSS